MPAGKFRINLTMQGRRRAQSASWWMEFDTEDDPVDPSTQRVGVAGELMARSTSRDVRCPL
jgi:hypothetical protein